VKVYTGSRVGNYGTAIIVDVLDPPSEDNSGMGDRAEEYPLPFVDKYEWERTRLGTPIPMADTPDSRRHEWGYGGTGAADTAASILADWFGEPQPVRIVQTFKRDIVARLGGPEQGGWTLTGDQITAWAAEHAAMIDQARREASIDETVLGRRVSDDTDPGRRRH
jgi:hypothetical protein